MIRQVQEVLPHVPQDAIRKDLGESTLLSFEKTITSNSKFVRSKFFIYLRKDEIQQYIR